VATAGGEAPPVDALVADLREALDLLGDVESVALGVVRVLVIDDDERLGELTARGLRRLGFDAETAVRPRGRLPREIVVFDLGVLPSLSADERSLLKAARPIVVTGAVDAGSRASAADFDASDYLVKPVDMELLAAAIKRRLAEERL
jgi:DNA-binding response OmpR family regulator